MTSVIIYRWNIILICIVYLAVDHDMHYARRFTQSMQMKYQLILHLWIEELTYKDQFIKLSVVACTQIYSNF